MPGKLRAVTAEALIDSEALVAIALVVEFSVEVCTTASMALRRSLFSLKLFLTLVFRMSATGKIFEVGVAFVSEFLVNPQL